MRKDIIELEDLPSISVGEFCWTFNGGAKFGRR